MESKQIVYDASTTEAPAKSDVIQPASSELLPDTDLLSFAKEVGEVTEGNDVTDFLTDEDTKRKVSFVMSWLSNKTPDRSEQALEYQKLKNQLGRPPIGKTVLQHIYQYVFLLSRSQELNKEIQNYGRR